jgi:hypothetical protein
MGRLRSLELEVRSVFHVADDISVDELALLIGSVFLDFFGCRLLLLVLLRS